MRKALDVALGSPGMTRHRRTQWLPAAIAAALALAVSACGGAATPSATVPGTSAPSVGPQQSSPAAPTGPQIGPEAVTIVAWDHHASPGASKRLDAVYAGFMAKYPQVTIERVAKSLDENTKTQKLALSGDDSPDLVMALNGFAGVGSLVENGLILPLDTYFDEWGWRELYTPAQLLEVTFTSDGKEIGKGSPYAVADGQSLIGVYYNEAKLTALGVEYPTTLDEFAAVCDKALAAGEVCISHADLEGFPSVNAMYTVTDQFASLENVLDWYYLNPSATLDDQYLAGVARWQEWATKGYFADGYAGRAYSEATTNFKDGKGVFLIDGTWVGAEIAQMGEIAGFRPMPPATAGGITATSGAFGNPWVISAKSKHPDVAAALLDYWQTLEARQISVDNNFLPPIATGLSLPAGSIVEAQAALLADAVRDNGLYPQMARVTSSSLTTFSEEAQKLMGNQITPRQFVDAVEANRRAFIETK